MCVFLTIRRVVLMIAVVAILFSNSLADDEIVITGNVADGGTLVVTNPVSPCHQPGLSGYS